MTFLKGPKMAVIWTVLRVWLGVQWLQAGINKVGVFDATGFLHGTIAKSQGENAIVKGWYATFVEQFALPNVELFNVLIPWGEVLVGIGLILGAATIPALLAAAFMNLNFLLAGTISTNPILYTAAMILLFAGAASYFYGIDRFAVKYMKEKMNAKKATKTEKEDVKPAPVH